MTSATPFAAFAARPGFTTAAVLTLALGIGANTAIFQLIDAVALRPLPIPNPHELVEVRIVGGNRGFGLNPDVYGGMTRPAWHELRDHQQALTGIFAWSARQRSGSASEVTCERLAASAVSGEFFAEPRCPAVSWSTDSAGRRSDLVPCESGRREPRLLAAANGRRRAESRARVSEWTSSSSMSSA